MTPKVFRINHQGTIRKAAGLFVRSLENERTKYTSSIPTEENVDIMDALRERPIRFITARRDQGGALTADIYGRLSGNAGIWLTTLSPVGLNSKDRDSHHPYKKAATT